MQITPEIVELDRTHLEEMLCRVEQSSIEAKDATLIRNVFRAYLYMTDLVEDKNISIRRLRNLLFGSGTEKTNAVVGRTALTPEATLQGATATTNESASSEPGPTPTNEVAPSGETDTKPAGKGHGRNGADDYPGAERIDVPYPSLSVGDPCPVCLTGTVYEKAPGIVVRITGQPPLAATVYQLQKLRCHLCGQVFTAPAPTAAGDQKYDATACSMICLLKYGTGFPFHRLEGLQEHLEIPLPASTQWDIVAAVATNLTPVFDELIRQAAQGDVIHNDDTTVKILELMKKQSRTENPTGVERVEPDIGQRTGLFTSGVVSLRDGKRVALFFSGRQHAGENLAAVLKHRVSELPPPIQMCDALSRNMPGELRTIVAHCLAHARRLFVDVYDRFPEPCRHLLEMLAVIYRNDATAREQNLTPEARLAYHQKESQPTMEQLHAWLTRQIDEKIVEPNSALGRAIRYMLRHWEKLTLFLRQAGAPLDNNICERALKKAILHRKNALFYKTKKGALVGDLFMSLIYSCQLNDVNPFDYLTQLQLHSASLAANPELWMPWNYRDQLTEESS